ncbi:MoaD/ThiS family protein [Ornithinicoccus halotolerans]|uniref:MoaD/ThiS family protein n=1 Tax=Ornithinicoccus halotolerans TaxID=1748220 RepID=UPI001295034E|nr:MoaD/ThiS family protein [Ornithinicoccus halotolerans]
MSDLGLRYWAAARAAAGCDQERHPARTVADALAAAERAHPALARVLPVSSLLVDGHRVTPETSVAEVAELGDAGHPTVEVLPPFAGG